MKIKGFLYRILWLHVILFCSASTANCQIPATCAALSQRSNSNGGANSCPNVSGTAYASNFAGTIYATVPVLAKTGNLHFTYSGANSGLLPLAITAVWLTNGSLTLQSISFGPAGVPVISGSTTQ